MREETEPPPKDEESRTLPRSGEIYRALLAYSRDAILGVNRKGTIVFWNKGAQQIFGYSTEEMLGQPVTKLISDKHRESHTLILRAVLSGNRGNTGLIEGEALKKDGSTFPLEWSLAIEQRKGKFLGLVIARNIAERKHMEWALRDSAERYCSLLENCLEAVFSGYTQSNTAEGNKALEKLCGRCLEELAELKPANTRSLEDGESLAKQVDMMLTANESVSSMVHDIFERDGRRILVERYLSAILDKDKLAGLQGFHGDMAGRDKTAEQLRSSFTDLARVVSRVVESCDPYTAGHQQRVAELACLVGENMGLAEDTVERLYLDGLVHDIGKVSIPGSILTKPGDLAEEEWALIRAHTKQGYSILKDVKLPWPIAEVALQHHERLDGSGYPDGVTGDELSLEVGILAVCDVVEAMSSHRPYRPARTATDVLQELRDGRGTKYDASVVDVILPMIESGEFRSTWNGGNSGSAAT